MKNNFFTFFENPFFWIIYVSILIFLPTYFFGNLGYYGDDFNMLESLNEKGFFGAIKTWLTEYGIFYRPVGISFLLSIYFVLGEFKLLFYSFSFLLYSLLTFSVYKVSINYFEDKNFSFFLSILFCSFPFNAAAFLQLSSMYMILTSIFFLFLLDQIKSLNNEKVTLKLIFLNLFWLIILLSYEQITGLVLIILFIFFMRSDFSIKIQRLNFFIKTFLFILTTLFFIFIYFVSDLNPKVQSIEKLNNQTKDARENIQLVNNTDQRFNTFSPSRFQAVKIKVEKSLMFLQRNITYTIEEIFNQALLGALLTFLSLLPLVFIFKQEVRGPPKNFLITLSFVGLVWIFATLSPFFLYESVHIPPYVLLLPSIGFAFLFYGVFWLIWPENFRVIAIRAYKVILAFVFLFFQFNQYGIYFAIKEELFFWKTASQMYLNGKEMSNLGPKNNRHVFWSENLYGFRHFKNITGEDPANFDLIYNKKNNTYSFTKKN